MSKYKIIGFEVISRDKLKPHPDAQLPMDDEDRDCLELSQDELGTIQPLLVTEPDVNGMHYILDGCNRFATSRSELLPCMIVECENPRELALTCMSTGRKRSAGQRIMAYLEMHRREVLKVAELVGDGLAQNRRVSRDTRRIPAHLEPYTVANIAKTLGVSNKDVGLGIEMLQCLDKQMKASWSRGALKVPMTELDMESEEDSAYYAALQKQHFRLLAGGSPIRRWKAAVAGRGKTEGKNVDVDYALLMRKSIITLRNCLAHWKEMPAVERAMLTDSLANIVETVQERVL